MSIEDSKQLTNSDINLIKKALEFYAESFDTVASDKKNKLHRKAIRLTNQARLLSRWKLS